MSIPEPLVVALPLDHETDDVLAAASALGTRLSRPIVVVHALHEKRLESESGLAERIGDAREALTPHLAKLRASGLEVSEEIACGPAADLVLRAVQHHGAELIVMGGGRPATVRRWLVGSVAEAVVRRAAVPVWIARGGTPEKKPVLCPVDLTPQSALGLAAAVRMARAFGVPLRVMTVLSPDAERSAAEMHEGIQEMLWEHDTAHLVIDVTVMSGTAAERIVDAAAHASLLVVGSRGFDPLVPEWLGPVTTRALRHGPCSLLAIREVDLSLERRQSAIRALAEAHHAARQLIADDRAAEALALIEPAAERAPANAEIQETYAIALDRVGRAVEARGRHEVAEMIRTRIGH